MELAGDEKRIQALFSELALENELRAPRFEKLWRDAAVTNRAPRRGRSLVMIVATLLVALPGLLAAWSRYNAVQSPNERAAQSAAPQTISNSAVPGSEEPEKVASSHRSIRKHPSRQRSLARHKQADRVLQQQAAMLANWQSPTGTFMASPTVSVFNSLPQLNQSVRDLESFLEKNHQSLKESNQ